MSSTPITWIASYPKSGNTWLRTLLSNIIANANHPTDINQLTVGKIAANRADFDNWVGIEASDLSEVEILPLRPRAIACLASYSSKPLYIKIHDAFIPSLGATPLAPLDYPGRVIYLLRNPLDVAVSFAYHQNISFEKVIKSMARSDASLEKNFSGISRQLRQPLRTWSEHVLSWVDQPYLPVHVMRYEDMVAQPFETFRAAVRFLELPDEPERIQRAIEFSSLPVLQAQERESGFKEKAPQTQAFFRKGQVGGWREELTPEQAARIVADHGEVMRRFGYLTADGEIVY